MATLLTPEPKPPSLFDLSRALYVLIPVLVSSCVTFKQGQSESSAGYKALVTSTIQLQQEVLALHAKDAALEAQLQALQAAMRLAEEPTNAGEGSDIPIEVEFTPDVGQLSPPAAVPSRRESSPLHLRPPPATLEEAVQRQEVEK